MTTQKKTSNTNRFLVGTVVSVHGLKGTLKVKYETNNPMLLLDIETVEIVLPKQPPFFGTVDSLEIEKSLLMLRLEEVTDRNGAEELVGAKLYTELDQISELEDDEFWVRDLIGVDVFTTEGVKVGTVSDVISGANELLEVTKLGGTKDDAALVPFVKALVPVVDLKANRIEVANLPGLLFD